MDLGGAGGGGGRAAFTSCASPVPSLRAALSRERARRQNAAGSGRSQAVTVARVHCSVASGIPIIMSNVADPLATPASRSRTDEVIE